MFRPEEPPPAETAVQIATGTDPATADVPRSAQRLAQRPGGETVRFVANPDDAAGVSAAEKESPDVPQVETSGRVVRTDAIASN